MDKKKLEKIHAKKRKRRGIFKRKTLALKNRKKNFKSYRRNLKTNFIINNKKFMLITYIIKTVFLLNSVIACDSLISHGYWYVAIPLFLYTVYCVFKFRLFHVSLLPKNF